MIQALDPASATRAELKEIWHKTFGTVPAPRLSTAMMADILIADLQWQRSGEQKRAVIRQLKRALDRAGAERPVAHAGTRLVREWNGVRHVVDVTDSGYVWNGTSWTSLSAIARAITGARWSGPRFFGVTP